MDDAILAQFQSTFLSSGEVHDPSTPHPHYSLYKQKRDGYASQEARRKKFLEEQQSKRRDFTDHARKIAVGEIEEDSDGEMEEGAFDEVDSSDKDASGMETDKKKRHSHKQRYPYRNQLMLSEWLVDVPSDFEENWLAMIIPVGRRSLVVSARKTTCAYSRAGALINSFPSLLPGGSRKTHRLERDYCILDCVFYEATQTYFILDVMCWAGHPVYDSDMEFRTYWKEQKVSECSDISKYSRINPLPFQSIQCFPCTKESLASVLAKTPSFQVDGLLFIHKECRYIIGRTPLAAWLKPHMIPDILGIPVCPEFLACSPAQSPRKLREKMETGERQGKQRGKMETGGEGHPREKMEAMEGESRSRPTDIPKGQNTSMEV